jgi:uncharacterized protein
MQTVKFGQRSGFSIPRANIGGMRLPADHDQAVAVIRHAIDNGMRYIDTCRSYGESEIIFGKALKNGYRQKVILSSKWSPWIKKFADDDVPTADCMRKRLDDSLRRLDVEWIDFYQIWNVNSRETWTAATRPGGTLDGIRQAMDEGLVKHTGMTTHDSVENLLEYLPTMDWCEVLLVTYNMLDRTYEPVLAAAHELGIGTITMNPVAGGRLVGSSPQLLELAAEVGAEDVPDLALRWILSNPNVNTFISGVSRSSDADAAVAAANAGPFSSEQVARINSWIRERSRQNTNFCTACGYCQPCPQGINIPAIMARIYEDRFWGLTDTAIARYRKLKEPRAGACVACGECQAKCTQKLKIAREMRYAAERYEKT